MVYFLSGQPSRNAADWWLSFVIGVNLAGSASVPEFCFLDLLIRVGSSSSPLAELFAGKTAGVGSGGKVYICGCG